MTSYKIKTYNPRLVAIIFFVSSLLFPYLLFVFHLDKSISLLLFLTLFFLLQFAIDKWFTYYIDVDISNEGIESNWHSNRSGEISKLLLWSDIEKWDYVSNGMAGAFILWTKENERLSIRFLNFFSMQNSLHELINSFSKKIELKNNSNATNTIKQKQSFYETSFARFLAVFAAVCSLVIVGVLFFRAEKIDSTLWLRAMLVISSNLVFIIFVYNSKHQK